MDILKRELAPITEEAWAYIDNEARDILGQVLSARRIVDVDGPRGWEHSCMTLGRLSIPEQQHFEGVNMGVRRVLPLVEARAPFELDIWELDNIVRGARDIDVTSLEKAAHDIARFEERAVYYGLNHAQIKGFRDATEHEPLSMGADPEDIVEKVTQGLTRMTEAGVQGPYALAVSPKLWIALSGMIRGFPLNKYVESMLGGPIVLSPFIDDAFLISQRGDDTILTIGQDMAIGYGSSSKEKVKLYFTETFTFHILEPRAILCYNWSQGG